MRQNRLKRLSFLILIVICLAIYAQKAQRVVIIGLDGFSVPGLIKTLRW
ncbi:hypothetical protein QTN47_24440 [Danxiaibacter flavus]|uniref:Alkaline phosphatase n=1 Tax=Danxiaibacter flavus TaxID=3049108 RepID=A0ABV3ZPH9_9BACT|nr:hypothetical protein QNM32_24445 [Chitinophagaceae bacterium DXS]